MPNESNTPSGRAALRALATIYRALPDSARTRAVDDAGLELARFFVDRLPPEDYPANLDWFEQAIAQRALENSAGGTRLGALLFLAAAGAILFSPIAAEAKIVVALGLVSFCVVVAVGRRFFAGRRASPRGPGPVSTRRADDPSVLRDDADITAHFGAADRYDK